MLQQASKDQPRCWLGHTHDAAAARWQVPEKLLLDAALEQLPPGTASASAGMAFC